MRAEQPRIEPDASDPFAHEACILACRHTTAAMPTAREQKLARLLARRSQVVLDRLPGLFGQLELDRPSRLPLPDGSAFDRVAGRRNALDLEGHHVATAQLAVDRQIEHGEVSGATLDHHSSPDRPDVLRAEWGLGSDQLALVPGRAGMIPQRERFILRHGSYSSVA